MFTTGDSVGLAEWIIDVLLSLISQGFIFQANWAGQLIDHFLQQAGEKSLKN